MIDWDRLVLERLESIFGEDEQGGEPVMYYSVNVAPFVIDGLLDAAYRDAELIDSLSANAFQLVLGVRLTRFGSPPQ